MWDNQWNKMWIPKGRWSDWLMPLAFGKCRSLNYPVKLVRIDRNQFAGSILLFSSSFFRIGWLNGSKVVCVALRKMLFYVSLPNIRAYAIPESPNNSSPTTKCNVPHCIALRNANHFNAGLWPSSIAVDNMKMKFKCLAIGCDTVRNPKYVRKVAF